VAGRGSTLLGFGLWRNLPLEWSLEMALVDMGMWVYLKTQPQGRSRTLSPVGVMMLLLGMTIAGQASSSAPPSMAAMAGSSLLAIGLVVGFGWWMDRDGEMPRP